jgi:hypothetical protein
VIVDQLELSLQADKDTVPACDRYRLQEPPFSERKFRTIRGINGSRLNTSALLSGAASSLQTTAVTLTTKKGKPVDPKVRALVAFVGASVGAVVLQQSASRQAAKLGIPHVAVGLVAAVIAHDS